MIAAPETRLTAKPADRSAWLAAGLIALAGIGLGLSHRAPELAPVAWIAMAVLAVGLTRTQRSGMALLGLGLAGIADLWIAHPWQLGSAQTYSGGSSRVTALIVLGFSTAHIGTKWLPVVLGWRICRRWPTSLWLPLAWVAGEGLRDWLTHLSYNDWLYTQWQVVPVLRTVGQLGWTPTVLLCLMAATALGDALCRRSWLHALPTLVTAGALTWAPVLPKAPPALLQAVGAVHMTGYFYPAKGVPPGIRLLIWPEQANYQRPWLPEGPGHGKRIEAPFPPAGTAHIYGLITRHAGGRQNSALLVAPDGTVVASRAKNRLFPLFERPLLGVMLPGGMPLVPGQLPAVLATPVGPVVSLVCLEGLERDYIKAQTPPGTALIALCANEQVLVHSRLAMTQFTAVAALTAAETLTPVVRASLYGTSAIVDADGTVLAVSEPDTDGVLTVSGDVIHHRATTPGQPPATTGVR